MRANLLRVFLNFYFNNFVNIFVNIFRTIIEAISKLRYIIITRLYIYFFCNKIIWKRKTFRNSVIQPTWYMLLSKIAWWSVGDKSKTTFLFSHGGYPSPTGMNIGRRDDRRGWREKGEWTWTVKGNPKFVKRTLQMISHDKSVYPCHFCPLLFSSSRASLGKCEASNEKQWGEKREKEIERDRGTMWEDKGTRDGWKLFFHCLLINHSTGPPFDLEGTKVPPTTVARG